MRSRKIDKGRWFLQQLSERDLWMEARNSAASKKGSSLQRWLCFQLKLKSALRGQLFQWDSQCTMLQIHFSKHHKLYNQISEYGFSKCTLIEQSAIFKCVFLKWLLFFALLVLLRHFSRLQCILMHYGGRLHWARKSIAFPFKSFRKWFTYLLHFSLVWVDCFWSNPYADLTAFSTQLL